MENKSTSTLDIGRHGQGSGDTKEKTYKTHARVMMLARNMVLTVTIN